MLNVLADLMRIRYEFMSMPFLISHNIHNLSEDGNQTNAQTSVHTDDAYKDHANTISIQQQPQQQIKQK